MSAPETPLHCKPDDQTLLNRLKEVDDTEIYDLNLNPELEGSNINLALNDDDANNQQLSNQQKRSREPVDEDMYDDVDDFKPRINISSPFSSNSVLNEVKQGSDLEGRHARRLSLPQQSKFISYCDDQLMHIQRRFIQSRGLNYNNVGYTDLVPLLKDLKALIDFIWYSIDGVPNTDYLLKQDLYEFEKEFDVLNSELPEDKSTSFGQVFYLLRIADDLIDYSEKFDITLLSLEAQYDTLSKLFKLLFILDKIFARLINGTVPGKIKISGTDSVRLCGIAERTRMRLPIFFEKQNIQGYHYELSKVYLESLERCSI
ncbi:hypothetical protein Kpol_1065p5 [Vanderwaltozyma polyspora DSM 70294]|uniref:Uncharacterized protein n=1 Tax=Vanderwaltozyma polyspora (strain ATCC 22028 / DSM 70294 / BCRC 21397 / CBS 2163 / NBRC 10782 / NRRL Y-8283 / UCD 57-17) TaxID=436907 RepID=A7TL29_VANPO|nr:uncharacterized protein Kpol_1065p5 [Vanderwaltozyma polyspora DSM 70294]EDO16992.1 hypothetical protein Kpol_1065p5 [Vanderwaltozyma polyspora DSM 70294]